jgi:hypothetical protein
MMERKWSSNSNGNGNGNADLEKELADELKTLTISHDTPAAMTQSPPTSSTSTSSVSSSGTTSTTSASSSTSVSAPTFASMSEANAFAARATTQMVKLEKMVLFLTKIYLTFLSSSLCLIVGLCCLDGV